MKKLTSIILSLIILTSITVVPCFADTQVPQTDTSGFSPIKAYMKQEGIKKIEDMEDNSGDFHINSSQAKVYTIPGSKGTLTSNAWRSTYYTISGNTYQWDYQVSAVYDGTYTVERIRTSWQGSASLRNSASISLGLGDSVSASASSTWQYTTTVVKYWENSNGATMSWYSSNMYVTPSIDYRDSTISIANTALVKLQGDPMPYQITASV